MNLNKEQMKLLNDVYKLSTYAYRGAKDLDDPYFKEEFKGHKKELLKSVEKDLHNAHEIIRELNKDIFNDEGQEYPVPYVLEGEEKNDRRK